MVPIIKRQWWSHFLILDKALQRQFNKTVFEIEQADYSREGVDWRYIEFKDNQATLDLIESNPDGILSALDSYYS